MDRKRFEESLLIYGADINRWPEAIKQAGLEALESSAEFKSLYKDHDDFENLLHHRRYEDPAGNFARRIISASLRQRQNAPFSIGSFITGVINELHIPRPAIAAISLAMVLAMTIGFSIGFTDLSASSVLNNTEETGLQTFLFDEGDII